MKNSFPFNRGRWFALFLLNTAFVTAALAQKNAFIVFDAPGAEATVPLAINQSGVVAGYYTDLKNHDHGLVRTADGVISTFDPPGFSTSRAVTINSLGQTAGSGSKREGATFVNHGFVRGFGGRFSQIDFPGAISTSVTSINDNGEVAGFFYDSASVSHGFVRDAAGNFTEIDGPAPNRGTGAGAINNSGEVTGSYTDQSLGVHGYVRDAAGNILTFDAFQGVSGTTPLAINSGGDITGISPVSAFGPRQCFLRHADGTLDSCNPSNEPLSEMFGFSINDNGVVAGTVSHHNGARTGFVRESSGNAFLVFGPTGTAGIAAINNSGRITGNIVDAGGVTHGFVR